MKRTTVLSLMVGVLLLTARCTEESNDEPTCGVPGSSQSCLCPGGGTGVQTCQTDGSWGECEGCEEGCSCDTNSSCQAGCDCDPDCGPEICDDDVDNDGDGDTDCDDSDCDCDCPGVCTPGGTDTEACGDCGSRSRTCLDNCSWDSWGACTGEGCSPSTTETGSSCERCGTLQRTCTSSCTWTSWSCEDQGPCTTGATQTCTNYCGTGTETCTSSCEWGTCTGGTKRITKSLTKDTFIEATSPGSSNEDAEWIMIGKNLGGSQVTRGLFYFDISDLPTSPTSRGITLTDAVMRVYVVNNDGCSELRTWRIGDLSWAESITYTAWDSGAYYMYNPDSFSTSSMSAYGWHEFSIDDFVQEIWFDGLTNYGFAINHSVTYPLPERMTIRSREYSGYEPSIIIDVSCS